MKASLSIVFENLRGKAGNVVIRKGRSGLTVNNRVTSKNPRTAAQQGIRSAFSKATATWKTLTSTQVQAWNAYALTVTKTNPITGNTYHPTGFNAFTGLAIKFLQINPTGTIPVTPPTSAFTGDTITITATGGSGAITFTATAQNATGIKTEILLQPLPNANRAPQPGHYRTKAFNNFGNLAHTYTATLLPGTYAAAYKFVNTATGQETPLQPLPVQQVTLALEVVETKTARQKKAA